MISPQYFIEKLKSYNIDFFTGVPDSLLKSICAYITENIPSSKNITAANEGAAIGLASGYHMATGNIPVVYMQNSGLGNAVNPLLSLVDKQVYNIPILLIIGWRGEPGIKDEPQHVKQGIVTIPLLDAMSIQFCILSKDSDKLNEQLLNAVSYMRQTKEPFALIVQKDTFEGYGLQQQETINYEMSREEAIQLIASTIPYDGVIISTTGMASRELFEYRESTGQTHEQDFLTVGSMGHASQIALGIALQKKNVRVYCFDGDGATIMQMGALSTIGTEAPSNYIHIILNNGAHDSVGGQPTAGLNINFCEIAKACGYKTTFSVDTQSQLKEVLDNIQNFMAPILLEVKVKKGARKNLGRPNTTTIQNKEVFMDFLAK